MTSPLPPSSRGRKTRLFMAVLLLFLAAWTVLPPPTYGALILAVVAPEVGAWLIVFATLIGIGAVRAVTPSRAGLERALPGRAPRSGRGRSPARLTVLLAVGTIAFAALPFIQFLSTASRFDSAMRAGLGDDYQSTVDESVRRRMRLHRLDVLELFIGLRGGDPRITRGVHYAVNDGVALVLDVYRPQSPGSYPAIVQIYGGGWQRGAPADNSAFASHLATHGFVVFAIDYRHAPRWRWPAQLNDVRAALEWIGRHGTEYDADPNRVAVLGRSSGAELAMVAAYEGGSRPVRAVVSYYGPVDLVEGYRHPPRPDPLDVRGILGAFVGGSPDEVMEGYRRASPITYVDRILPPTLLVYAAHDHVVESRFGRMLHSALLATGTTSVFLEIPWAEHGFDAVSGGPSAQLTLYYTERFLAWALRPATTP